MTVIAMSRTEIDRMSVLKDLATSRIKIAEAATRRRRRELHPNGYPVPIRACVPHALRQHVRGRPRMYERQARSALFATT